MSLKRAVPVLLLLLGPAAPARALVKKLAAEATEGAMEKVQPVIAATLADVDRRLVTHEDRIGNIAGKLIDQTGTTVKATVEQVNQSMEARITQVQRAATAVTDQALDHVDQISRDRLVQVDEIAKKTVTEVNKDARALLDRTDDILRQRSADLGRMVNDAVGRADQALAARIDQIDEVAGRRLGNVDVIASRQRIALERTSIQVAVLVGLVVFIVFVFKRLIAEHGELVGTEEVRQLTGARRTWMMTRALTASGVKQVALAGVAVGVLLLLYHQLPLGAQHEQDELVAKHARALDSSLAQFDFTRARYHASQLELLMPDDDHHRALSAKAELLRDVFSRPTLWASDSGLAELQKKVAAVDRLTRTRPDPDVLVVQAMLLWQSGQSRADEQRAASLCGRALRLRPAGFALGVLARAYIETYLQAPWVPPAGIEERGESAHGTDELRDILAATPMEDRGSPLATPLALSRLMRTLDERSSDAYVAMIEDQAKLAALLRERAPVAEAKAARERRNARAAEVVAAFEDFDRELMSLPGVRSVPDTLAIFRLDDVPYTRAAWYLRNKGADTPAPLLEELKGSNENIALRIKLAPPRVTWSRRFKALIDGPARGVLEFQEAERFKIREQRARALEVGMSAGDRASLNDAAVAAARLGLYFEPPGAPERTPLGRVLAPEQATAAESDLARALRDRGVRLL
jgi:hypothetical protein